MRERVRRWLFSINQMEKSRVDTFIRAFKKISQWIQGKIKYFNATGTNAEK